MVKEVVKKMHEKMGLIKYLLKEGLTQAQISRKTNIPKQTVSRLIKKINNEKNNIIEIKKERKKDIAKLPIESYKKIIKKATDKTTSQMSGGHIADIINKDLKKNFIKRGKILSISCSQVNRILKKKLIKRRVRKVFYLREKKQRRKNFIL